MLRRDLSIFHEYRYNMFVIVGSHLLKYWWKALAAIGQCRLISLWDMLFGHLRQPIAQILLTRNDIADVSQLRTQN